MSRERLHELMDAQEREWPGSRLLIDGAEAFRRWALPDGGYGSITQDMLYNGWHIMACLAQHRVTLFYETPQGHRGCRYGTEGHEYISGFYPMV